VLVVNPNQTAMSTAQNLIPNDDATLTGATSNAGGTITFNLFSPSDATCAGTPAYTLTVNVSGNGTYSTTNTTFVASALGTWRWQVIYSGDANNVGSTSACGVEQFTIANG
jgi:predicted peptidase